MAPDQGSENTMTPESDEGVVIGVFVPVILVVCSPTIVEARFKGSSGWSERTEITGSHDHTEIPKLHTLLFAVT